MGNSDSKLNFRKAVVQLTNTNEQMDEMFWDQLWTEGVASVQDLFALMPASDVRTLRDDAAANLATLCYKAVEKLASAADSLLQVDSPREQHVVLNCVRLLTRLVPYIFEDPDWRGFFWSSLPVQGSSSCVQEDSQVAAHGEERQISLAHTLLSSLCDLLFCPDFTVQSSARSNSASLSGPDGPEEVTDSCELIWEPGVGCAQAATRSARHDSARAEILKLLLTLFSDIMYHHQQLQQQLNDARLTDETAANSNASSGDRQSADYVAENRWLDIFTSSENRHALPLFTSLLNTVCGYHPDSSLMPLNHLLFEDSREPLVEVALQVLIGNR